MRPVPTASGGSPVAAGLQRALQGPGEVGAAIGDFHDTGDYFRVVYGKGEAALLTARQQAGAAAFDAAVRCYVNAAATARRLSF